jgi:hypothetical protein
VENNGRRLGWIAIGIGVVALLVALFNRGPGWQMSGMPYGYAVPSGMERGYGPAAPAAPGAPQSGFGPQERFGPREGFGMRHESREGMYFGARGHHGPGFFFWPFFWIGGLLKLALFGLLLFLGIKLLRRGRHRDHWPHDRPGPEPPATGQTTTL